MIEGDRWNQTALPAPGALAAEVGPAHELRHMRAMAEFAMAGYGGGAERRGNELREVMTCDFLPFYNWRQSGGDISSRPEEIYGKLKSLSDALGDPGVSAGVIAGELMSNYYDFCKGDIEKGIVDKGHRKFTVAENPVTHEVFAIYEDEYLVTSKTYNVYARAFGQDIEREEGQSDAEFEAAQAEAAAEREAWQALPEEERLQRLRMAAFAGNAAEGEEELGERGRGLLIMLILADQCSISRFGPGGRGAVLHFRMRSEPAEPSV